MKYDVIYWSNGEKKIFVYDAGPFRLCMLDKTIKNSGDTKNNSGLVHKHGGVNSKLH